MPNSELTGLVQTVLGTVSPDVLGPTTTHEHLMIDFRCMFNPPAEVSDLGRAHAPLTMEILGWVHYNWFDNADNLMLDDEETAIAEAALYQRAGGGTIVDATTFGIGRDPLALARIARATGLNIVMGAGYYVDMVHPPEMDDLTEADIARRIVDEVRTGVGETGVKAGIIGEIGCSWPLTRNERKVLQGAAVAQQETGASILIHPGRDDEAPREILDVLAESGADLGRVIMGHLDRTTADYGVLTAIARSGCYLEYDLFGLESSYYPLSDMDMPSDAQRMDLIKRLVDDGYGERVVIAHDICTKHRLVKYGGHGWAHILEHIAPGLRHKGLSEEAVHSILVENPARALTFA
ncbi:MAG: phosphotriesterase-related protein [Chloroflexi bacterium]|nr:phosphotriesterase-related protein [Chloroflexota bacterium]